MPMAPLDESISTQDGTNLAVRHWRSPGGPVILYFHGIQSHMGWFAQGAEKLQLEYGYDVWTLDRRGSGNSGGPPGHMPSFQSVVGDLLCVVACIRQENPDAPIYGLGFSLGANYLASFAIEHQDTLQGLVMVSPGIVPRTKVGFGRRIWVLLNALVAPKRLFELPIRDDEFTRDPKASSFVQDDPLRTRAVSGRFFLELLRMKRHIHRNASSFSIPVLTLLADEDSIIDNDGVLDWVRSTKSPDRIAKVYKNCLHSLQFELPQEEFLSSIADWIGTRDAENPGTTHDLQLDIIERNHS